MIFNDIDYLCKFNSSTITDIVNDTKCTFYIIYEIFCLYPLCTCSIKTSFKLYKKLLQKILYV